MTRPIHVFLLLLFSSLPVASAGLTETGLRQVGLLELVSFASFIKTREASDLSESPSSAFANELNQRALFLLERGSFAKALSTAREALAVIEKDKTSTRVEVAVVMNTLGLVLHQLVELSEAQVVMEQALQIREQFLGASHPLVAESLTNLARVLYAQGQFADARPLLEKGRVIRIDRFGALHPDVGVSLIHLAIVDMQLGDLVGSQHEIEQAVGILESVQQTRPLDLAMALNVLGNVLKRQGKYAVARSSLERSLALREEHLGNSHPHVARTITRLGTLAAQMGDLPLALSLLQRALTITEDALGHQNAEVAGGLNEVGRIYRMMGDLDSAHLHFKRALRIQENTLGTNHPFLAVTLNELGRVSRLRAKWELARQLFMRALTIQESSVGPEHPFLAETLTNLGYVEGRIGRLAQASKSFKRALELRQKTLEGGHPDLASSYVDMAKIFHAKGNFLKARKHYELARHAYLRLMKVRGHLDDRTLSHVWSRQLAGLQHFLLLLGTEISTHSGQSHITDAIEEGFSVAEQARGWIVQATVAKVLAGQQAKNIDQAKLVRHVDELRQQRQQLWTQLNQQHSKLPADRDDSLLQRLTQEAEQAERDLQAQVARIEKTFPRLAELTMPKPMTVEEMKKLSYDHEAVLSFYALSDRLQVWVVRRGVDVRYHEVPISRSRLVTLIDQFRQTLLPTFNNAIGQMVLPAVDIRVADELYRILLEPIMPYLKNVNNLIVIPDSVLLPLPFGALLTDGDSDNARQLAEVYREGRVPGDVEMRQYAQLPWLAKRFPITVLPTASAFKLIRGQEKTQADGSLPFLGFGDPLLQGRGQERGGAMLVDRGLEVDRGALLALNRLPGTRDELLAVASALGVNQDGHVFLADAATETTVRNLQEAGRLGQARVLAFATHGLLAGELRGLTQPALVLTPPATLSEQDDGLLSMEEILQWHLPSTEWVILSACNTGASDGSGEGLSGLARAFFYAGAKMLLVSHWSVDDNATKHLMKEVFQRYSGDTTLSPAEALQQGMLALMRRAQDTATSYFAHPYAWAPFFLIGASK